jgi:hypothetical protein
VVLHEQRHVVDDDPVLRRGGHQLGGPRADARVDDAVEGGAGGLVGEHAPRELGPVEHAVTDHVVAEGLPDRGEPVGAGFDDLASDPVGVDHRRTVLGEPPGHCGLAGADPAGEAYAQHAGILAVRHRSVSAWSATLPSSAPAWSSRTSTGMTCTTTVTRPRPATRSQLALRINTPRSGPTRTSLTVAPAVRSSATVAVSRLRADSSLT